MNCEPTLVQTRLLYTIDMFLQSDFKNYSGILHARNIQFYILEQEWVFLNRKSRKRQKKYLYTNVRDIEGNKVL